MSADLFGDTVTVISDTDQRDQAIVVAVPATAQEPKHIACPFKIMIDSREQSPYTFLDIRSDSDKGYAVLDIPTERYGLPNGDYCVFGFPQMVVERKSKSDLYSSIAQRRDNFEQRLCRIQEELRWAAVVIEAEMTELINDPPPHTQFKPKALIRTIDAWMMRYPRIHWVMCPGRRVAEIKTFRLLERWWKDNRHADDLIGL